MNSKGQVQMIMESKKIIEQAKAKKEKPSIEVESELEAKIATFTTDLEEYGKLFKQDYIRGLNPKD
jgi:hypothetical protein